MTVVLARDALDELFAALVRRGYAVIAPTVRDGAIVYDEIASSADLPAGWTDEQDGGRYRLRRRDDAAVFGYAVGPHSFKPRRLPPQRRLWRARLGADGGLIEPVVGEPEPQRVALVGARSCELHAMDILDHVLGGPMSGDVFVVAVQCGQAGGTCFCVSMDTGPVARDGFDLALTELCDADGHRFLVEVGTDRGAAVVDELPHEPAAPADVDAAMAAHARAASQMGRTLDTDGLHDALLGNLEHPRWDDVAARCLSCGNCTMVCPTCFCTSVEDVTDLAGEHVERHERWDSCFTVDHSHLHGGAVRDSTRARYRQWVTHKLATWIDQFGSSGCVGCGRCITWCPVGIDITEEAGAIRADA